jgi:hypothetical protein
VHPLDFPLWLRALHFCNLLFVTLLIRSGLEIVSAHPKLYWNDDCLPGSAWLKFGRAVPNTRQLAPTPHFGHAVLAVSAKPTGKTAIGTVAFFLLSALYIFLLAFVVPRTESRSELLWTSTDEEISLPSWLALPGHKNLGMGRHWHFLRWRLAAHGYCALHTDLCHRRVASLGTRIVVDYPWRLALIFGLCQLPSGRDSGSLQPAPATLVFWNCLQLRRSRLQRVWLCLRRLPDVSRGI